MTDELDIHELLEKVCFIHTQSKVAEELRFTREEINRWLTKKVGLKPVYRASLMKLLPEPTEAIYSPKFKFIDLFAGIGGIRKGFEAQGGMCVFTSEWDKYALRTYMANHYCEHPEHVLNQDIRDVTLSNREDIPEEQAYENIQKVIPDHDVLLAGFPCQPFSIAGVSKKNSLGRKHGFECNTQGTLFFDVARIIKAKQPKIFLLENVKNLKSHNKGHTFRTILETLDELGYVVSDSSYVGKKDPKVVDAANFLPQHRERIVLVGFRKDLDIHEGFSLSALKKYYPKTIPSFGDILESREVHEKYILTPKLWKYLYDYAAKHKAKGNGFGYGLTRPNDKARTLSARYYKDGSEILVDRGWDFKEGFESDSNNLRRPRRLTPTECARLMGFDAPGQSEFVIPVSDTQAYKQFGNSVAVPVFEAIAKLLKKKIIAAKNAEAKKVSSKFKKAG
ncbi:DNA-cytosine methyltransferase [Methylophaga thiooxydans]|uniref:Cytosine-specific methyltransferase n=1 Tax=Methylophaga thiooxydans TaxID=392484 RepID=A0A0A0BGD6_9GAMM|nr:DNA (cytosine-5-)-methyltransferase [Methylophaga thiooxydans]KGM06945.1 DNA-cytosine methyltransferase [Methylophaga thiooxydans]